ncbi:tRNA pseudouridine(38-40) synthase TruA [Ruminococcus sp.]|uniref:tRNA pseudouridine(38-40) synthase TruA n=1 Tax=Ruminococcus sp. TaxID=41978 RepID=UPI001B4625D4|nr:tRNA pseudouridine(38-40) synthase TruA [Ruminococcus sp.]MBP5433899.1 tRNA pseudouridine(38-40) synthase TruA [Ruminococcus sp.]
MRNLKVMTAYRGTNYHGFQRQENAMTVQEVLESKLSKVLNEPVSVTGCSRTDTGVHANMFCFNVKTSSKISCLGFCRGVNGELPEDISILSCEDAPPNFHARYDCKGKEYIYKMHCSESKNPFAADLMLHYRRKFDIEAARKAAVYLVGTHDFSSFCADCTNVSTTVRTIYSFKIENRGDSVIMLVKGNGFLYNMIRIIAGTIIDVSEKRIAPDDIPAILAAKDRLRAGRTAMAHGLYLNRVFYSEEELMRDI